MLGSNNFMTDYSVKQIDSYRVYCLSGFGMLTYFLLYHGTLAFQLYQKKGHIWSKGDSYYFTQVSNSTGASTFKLKTAMVKLILVRYASSICANINNIFIFRTAIQSGVSSSVIISLFSATSVMISIMFYLVFKEKLHREHFVGIFFLIFSVALIANAKDPQSLDPANATSPIEQSLLAASLPTFVPMLLVLVNCSFYALNSLMSRYSKFHGIPSLQFSADSSLSIVVINTTLFIHQHFFVMAYTWGEAWPVLLGSALMVVGTISLNGATAYGKAAGAVQALIQLQAPWQLILESTVGGKGWPQGYGVAGMASGIFGACLMMFWKSHP